jgi:hypothetical protein
LVLTDALQLSRTQIMNQMRVCPDGALLVPFVYTNRPSKPLFEGNMKQIHVNRFVNLAAVAALLVESRLAMSADPAPAPESPGQEVFKDKGGKPACAAG